MKQLLRVFGLFITITLLGTLVSPLTLAQSDTPTDDQTVIQSNSIDTLPADADPPPVPDEPVAPPPAEDPAPVIDSQPPVDPVQPEEPVVSVEPPPAQVEQTDSPPVQEDPADPPLVTEPDQGPTVPEPQVTTEPVETVPVNQEPEIVETVVATEPPVTPTNPPAKTPSGTTSRIGPLPTCVPEGTMLLTAAQTAELTFCDVTKTPKPATPTPTATTTPTSTETPAPTIRISRIAVDCDGNGEVAIRNGIAGASLTLVTRYKQTAASSWKDSGNTTTVVLDTTTTRQKVYPFSIDIVTGVPADAFDIRVSVQSTSNHDFSHIDVDSASLCPCFATPTPSPTTTPDVTPEVTITPEVTVTPEVTITPEVTTTPEITPTPVTPTPTDCEDLGNSDQDTLGLLQVTDCPTEPPTETPTPTIPPTDPPVTPVPTECPGAQQASLALQVSTCPTEPPVVPPTEPPTETITPSPTPTTNVPPSTVLVTTLPSAGTDPAHEDGENGLLILMLASSVSLAGIGFLMARDSRSRQRE